MTCTRVATLSILGQLSREIVPLFIVMGGGVGLIHTLVGPQPPWMLVVFATIWLLTAARALFGLRRGSYVPWSSCAARPFQTLCIFALNTAPWVAVGFLSSPTASSPVVSAAIPGWICGLGAALAVSAAAWPMRRYGGVNGQPVEQLLDATVATLADRRDRAQQPACCMRADQTAA